MSVIYLIIRVYGLLLRLTERPRQFRAEFEDEMQFVFARALVQLQTWEGGDDEQGD